MEFTKIDLDTWTRTEVFNHFIDQKTTYSMTHNVPIDRALKFVKENHYNFYPLFIFSVLKVVNSNYLYRMAFNDQGELGYWDSLVPFYSIFDNKTELFSNIDTENTYTFAEFHRDYLDDIKQYQGTGKLFPKQPVPQNVVNISMMPWVNYSSFNLNIGNNDKYLLPIVTAGKFEKDIHQKRQLPVTFQIHHAVCDGYQTGLFFNRLEELLSQPEKL
ncbi:CatA-like O-acetyltransferase [Companilactobacillus halodurans]|uniref:Type A chloramphenicol O-acetyltransferase n=1 Tax=Companilactobacillus halodurans TaxID=2584183 RepID=A0A5P0ZUK3_9LACO|nr:type A chloramphenicol O-acetyltransferase [Companilactobacillus halodurans]MQS96595.1 type A chloramphenicol O-acetyltransferase [Companilactobacillus halodurans]